MPNVRVVADDARVVRFAFPHLTAFFVMLFGLAMIALLAGFIEPSPSRMAGIGVGVFFAGLGLVLWLWRDTIELDLAARRWTRTRGFVFGSGTSTSGAMGALALSIELNWDTKGEGRHRTKVAEWEIGLWFDGDKRPVTFFETRDETEAWKTARSWAGRLGLEIADRTDGHAKPSQPPRKGPAPVDSRASFVPQVFPEVRHGGRVRVSGGPGSRRIDVPAPGFGMSHAVLVLTGFVFAGFGAATLMAVSGIWRIAIDGPVAVGWVLGAVFVAVGLFFMHAALAAARRSHWVKEDAARIVTGTTLSGRERIEETVHKRAIEAIELVESSERRSAGSGRRHPSAQVRVRTAEKIVRIDLGLDEAEKAWLRDALAVMASTGVARSPSDFV